MRIPRASRTKEQSKYIRELVKKYVFAETKKEKDLYGDILEKISFF